MRETLTCPSAELEASQSPVLRRACELGFKALEGSDAVTAVHSAAKTSEPATA